MSVQVVQGFSLLNRWLLYTSFMLSPAQFLSGMGSNCPSNFGFLAYNWYTQITWYKAVRAKELHALSLLPVHFNILYSLTYLGGVSAGHIVLGVLLGFGTAGVMILNTVAAWVSWKTNQPDGYGVYQFFFFGWRTLTPGWHTFILCWQIADSLSALSCVIAAIAIPIFVSALAADEKEDVKQRWYLRWWTRYPAIPVGAVAMLLIGWPLILWTELIVARNRIESETDMVAVWLFVAQVGAMLVPGCSAYLGCFRPRSA